MELLAVLRIWAGLMTSMETISSEIRFSNRLPLIVTNFKSLVTGAKLKSSVCDSPAANCILVVLVE